MKQLILCRHAKSSWKHQGLDDIDRPLNRRGKENALLMGERLAGRRMIPDLILSSPAKRARKTAVRLCRGMQASKELIRIKKALYATDCTGLLKVISKTDDCYKRVMLIGHNHELTRLANLLAPVDIYNVPTCGVVVYRLAVKRWLNVGQARAELLFFDYPKKQDSDLYEKQT
jgi:phosphohistidine phosphatase